MPTVVPTAAFSVTALAAALVSLTGVTSNSSTSLTVMVALVAIEPSAEVARTVIAWVAPASRSMRPPPSTTPACC